MKIQKRTFPSMRHYVSQFGKLVIQKDSKPKFYPSVLGGHVGKDLTRQEAVECLKTWRQQP